MAEPDQPKKETVRIVLPQPPVTPQPPNPSVKPRETVRIQLPVRETGSPAGPSSPPPPAASRPLSASVHPPPMPPPLVPKKETVRMPLITEPLRSAQKKTQPLISMPDVIPQNPAIAVAPIEKRPMLLYWMLLGISALILIIEIWTYFS